MAYAAVELPPAVGDDDFVLPPPAVDDELFLPPAVGNDESFLPLPQKSTVADKSPRKLKRGAKEPLQSLPVSDGRKSSMVSKPPKKLRAGAKEPLQILPKRSQPRKPVIITPSKPLPDPTWLTAIKARGEDLMELFSIPRLVPVCQARGMLAEVSLDLETGWDCNVASMRALAFKAIDNRKPRVVMLSPPCTMYSPLQRMWNEGRMDPLRWEARKEEADGFMAFGRDVAVKQSMAGRGFILEHPGPASSWDLPSVQEMMGLPGAQVASFAQCRYGLRGPEGKLMRKHTKLLSNIPQIMTEFHGKNCQCARNGDTHERIQGSFRGISRSHHAQVYPPAMVDALVSCCQDYVTQ